MMKFHTERVVREEGETVEADLHSVIDEEEDERERREGDGEEFVAMQAKIRKNRHAYSLARIFSLKSL